MIEWKKYTLEPDNSIRDALNILDKVGSRIVLVCKKGSELLGTVTDGDIRRGINNNINLDSPLSEIMNKNPIISKNSITDEEALKAYKDYGVLHIPILDNNNKIIDIHFLHQKSQKIDNPVFLLAGGFGKRLHPLTFSTPKPLLKVGDKPIIETILRDLSSHGFKNFYVSLHYKSKQFVDFFDSNPVPNITITHLFEETPLGTAGSLGMLPKEQIQKPLFVMNADILTKVNYIEMLNFHLSNNFDATIGIREFEFELPYGEVEVSNNKIKRISEKPRHKFFINAGIYILNPEIIIDINGKDYLDMPQLLESSKDKYNIGAFPIHEYWIDIGKMDQFKKAQKDILVEFE